MTGTERKLLLWCAAMLIRGHSLESSETEEIKGLIGELMSGTPHKELPSMTAFGEPLGDTSDEK